MDTQNQRENRLINLRNTAIGAGVIGTGLVASNTHAIGMSDVQKAYTDSGATETVDGTGVIIITLAVTITIIGLIVALVKKK
ncbi:hypothetical protein F966_03337 [Acinetobacter higginsii]|uniref:Uncharacterized protein n=1 Tax=Acinetobacter higginsii TaxID=70347 RepID=N8XGT4_9GAMM|nr:hypothetical protein [Acinetobacter higginsii]ENV08274.1 hypothetical protein F966_03337 [Acinetobacter higginsii]